MSVLLAYARPWRDCKYLHGHALWRARTMRCVCQLESVIYLPESMHAVRAWNPARVIHRNAQARLVT